MSPLSAKAAGPSRLAENVDSDVPANGGTVLLDSTAGFDAAGGDAIFDPGNAFAEEFEYSGVDTAQNALTGITRINPTSHPAGSFVVPEESPPSPTPTSKSGGEEPSSTTNAKSIPATSPTSVASESTIRSRVDADQVDANLCDVETKVSGRCGLPDPPDVCPGQDTLNCATYALPSTAVSLNPPVVIPLPDLADDDSLAGVCTITMGPEDVGWTKPPFATSVDQYADSSISSDCHQHTVPYIGVYARIHAEGAPLIGSDADTDDKDSGATPGYYAAHARQSVGIFNNPIMAITYRFDYYWTDWQGAERSLSHCYYGVFPVPSIVTAECASPASAG